MLTFERWKISLVLVIALLGIVYAIPNFLTRGTAETLPSWVPHKQINLGLDLQGGSHLLLEVDVATVLAEQLEALIDEVRVTLRGAGIGYNSLGRSDEGVKLTLRDSTQFNGAHSLLSGIDTGLEVEVGSDDGSVSIQLSDAVRQERKLAVLMQSIEIVRRRIDETGTREPTIQRQGEDRILVQLPGIDDPERVKRLLGKTAKMNFRMVDEATPVEDAIRGRVPPGSELLFERGNNPEESEPTPVVIRKRVSVSGDNLLDAQPTFQDNQPVVSLRFDNVGARKFGALTKENVGKRFAIVLDGEVISAPVIREPIPGGNGIISGRFTVQSAQDLALLLNPLRTLWNFSVSLYPHLKAK